MKTSVGNIITDGKTVLIGHVTGTKRWDIPKGTVDDGETPIETCIRETAEETSLEVSQDNLVDLGEFWYLKSKKLHLFKCEVDKLPDLDDTKCVSTFTDKKGNERPEFDYFHHCPVDELKDHLTLNMYNTLKLAAIV